VFTLGTLTRDEMLIVLMVYVEERERRDIPESNDLDIVLEWEDWDDFPERPAV
jgi:hypothetical protein